MMVVEMNSDGCAIVPRIPRRWHSFCAKIFQRGWHRENANTHKPSFFQMFFTVRAVGIAKAMEDLQEPRQLNKQ
jgi:hypothetical protein